MVRIGFLAVVVVVCAHAAGQPFDLVMSGETVTGIWATVTLALAAVSILKL